MTPSFRHVGGKARLRKWLVDHFPESGSFYEEPFAGKANVFFEAVQRLRFNYWILSDINTRFLDALLMADLSRLPESVTKESFADWRKRAEIENDPVARVIEPRITFAGKGYAHGFSGTSGSHVGYNGVLYQATCQAARRLLTGANGGTATLRTVSVRQRDWRETFELASGESGEFLYCDPPYYNTDAPYSQIDHQELVERLNAATFSWALSGYRNDLYDARLEFKCRFEYERNSEIKSSNSGKREPVIETLWTNYEL